jgi:SpoVK/Ycf46/Vps4 family AAA+-type ATPase
VVVQALCGAGAGCVVLLLLLLLLANMSGGGAFLRVPITHADYAHLAAETEGFSGSDIQVVVREALMEPIRNLDIATHFKPVRALNLEGVMEDGMFQMCKSTDPHAREMRFSEREAHEGSLRRDLPPALLAAAA